MSEIGRYRSRVRISLRTKTATFTLEDLPAFKVLQRAVELVAREHNGKLTRVVKDYYGRETRCDLAIVTPEFPRGVGVQVNRTDGAVVFVYDQYGGYGHVVQRIVNEITQNYLAIALIRAMKSLGYEVKEEPHTQGVITLVGVMR